ncbi:MAG: hypothetical protein BWZ08_01085 [candidate division BRC1 bacterium ADurb.BinA292]|nr:MAG: hypothetical protein BWZ08_01085 [candidate division BRC1 bacterium ADurb.BinA292]
MRGRLAGAVGLIVATWILIGAPPAQLPAQLPLPPTDGAPSSPTHTYRSLVPRPDDLPTTFGRIAARRDEPTTAATSPSDAPTTFPLALDVDAPTSASMAPAPVPTPVFSIEDYPSSIGLTIDRTALWGAASDVVTSLSGVGAFTVLRDPEHDPWRYRAWFDAPTTAGLAGASRSLFTARARLVEGPWLVWAGEEEWIEPARIDRHHPVILPGGQYYDAIAAGDAHVVKLDSTLHLTYSSTGPNADGVPGGQPGDIDGSIRGIMGGRSSDGLTWELSPTPLLLKASDFAGLPLVEGQWHEMGSYRHPALVRDGDRWRIWFDYATHDGPALGYAENLGDFVAAGDWLILNGDRSPLARGLARPTVVNVDGVWYGYARLDPRSGHPRPGGWLESISLDGHTWRTLGFLELPGAADDGGLRALAVERDEGWLVHLFYPAPSAHGLTSIRMLQRAIPSSERDHLPPTP